MSNPIQVGLVSFGISARTFHAPFLDALPEYRLHTVWERHGSMAPSVYPAVRSVRDPAELFDNPEIELIVITSPNDTHAEYAARALRSAKHVVVEKPMTVFSAEAASLMDIAASSGKVLSVFQNRRYVSDFRTVREILDQKLLGRVHEFEAHYDRYRPGPKPNAWREEPGEGRGILYDLGPHLIDQAFCLFGLPEEVYADIRLERPHARTIDYFDLQLYYPGLKVILKGGMLVREPGPRYMIHGFDGSFIKSGDDPQEVCLKAGERPLGAGWGEESPDLYGLLHTEQAGKVIRQRYPSLPGNYGLFYKNLYKTLREGAPLRETPAHGYNAVRMIELALESHSVRGVVKATGLKDVPY